MDSNLTEKNKTKRRLCFGVWSTPRRLNLKISQLLIPLHVKAKYNRRVLYVMAPWRVAAQRKTWRQSGFQPTTEIVKQKHTHQQHTLTVSADVDVPIAVPPCSFAHGWGHRHETHPFCIPNRVWFHIKFLLKENFVDMLQKSDKKN